MKSCRWKFVPGLDPAVFWSVTASYDVFADTWRCDEHHVNINYTRGTAPATFTLPGGSVAQCCRDEVAARKKRERTQRRRWWAWYFRTLLRRVLDVIRGADTGGDGDRDYR